MNSLMTLIGRNDNNTEGMTVIALSPLLGHKKAMGTLGYPIASKLED